MMEITRLLYLMGLYSLKNCADHSFSMPTYMNAGICWNNATFHVNSNDDKT